MELNLTIKCGCKNSAHIRLDDSGFTGGNESHLSESIEQNSKGSFYCSQDYSDGVDINCAMCGDYIRLVY